VIFSDSLVPDMAGDINAVINITNDNWFGNTPGVYQHLDMVRRYAIESGLPVVRANYSGISAFIASDGNIISSLPVGQSGVLDGYVWGAHKTSYQKIGLNSWMIIILLFGCLGMIVCAKRK
jgi:apolipoprotein N-acyltransferase